MSDLDKDQVTLSAADAAAVDAILERDAAAQAAVDPVRHARVEAWLKILASAPATAPADLAVRTLAAIQSAPLPFPQPQTTAQEAPAAPTGRWRRRLAEFGAMAVAAMLLLLVTLQAMGQAQRSRARVACATNLQKLATGFNDYADFANGELPCIALPANRNWLRAGEKLAARNNTANLIPLVNHNFAPTTAFYCPGTPLKAPPPGPALLNELPPISYSYRNLYGSYQISWDRRHETMILADKNPLFADAATIKPGIEQTNSPNHDGRGNYVLRADSSVTWEVSPNIGPDHDNIWTLVSGGQRLLTYSGTEYSTTLSDVFFGP